MKKTLQCALVLGLVAVLAGTASAQEQRRGQGQGQRQPGGGFGMGGGMSLSMLLGQKSVQEDLKVTEDQTKKITEMAEKARAAFGQGGAGGQNLSREERAKRAEERAKESEKAIAEILKPEQVKRLKEIRIGYMHKTNLAGLLADKEVQTAIKFTEEQGAKLKALNDDSAKFMQELFGGGGGGGGGGRFTDEQRQKMQDFNKSHGEKIAKLLTDDQKAKIKELAGAEFKGEIQPFGGRRPGGGGN